MAPNRNLIPLSRPELIGLGVGRRTLGRYITNPPPGFPTPIYQNGRIYFASDELDAYKAQLVATANSGQRRQQPGSASPASEVHDG